MANQNIKMAVSHLDFYYDKFQALHDINIEFGTNLVTALIGPSGCGKSTLLRCLNRMNDLIPISRVHGSVVLDGMDIYDPAVDVVWLRRRIGMVFQKPNPFPKSIFENVAYGLRVNGIKDKNRIHEKVEQSLKHAAIWDEVKDRLADSALGCPAVSSSGSVLPGPWPWNRMCCSWMSRPRLWIPLPHRRSKS